MNKLVLLCVCMCGLLSCTTHQPVAHEPSQYGSADFLARTSFPYQASEERRLRIERAARELPVGATEAQVLALLGPPDYKGRNAVLDKQHGGFITTGETWQYVHTMDHPYDPGDIGKMLMVAFTFKTNPPTVFEVLPYNLGKRAIPYSQTQPHAAANRRSKRRSVPQN